MSAKQWAIVYWIQFSIEISFFVFCLIKHWQMLAWFAVFPIGAILSAVIRKIQKKKISNQDTC
jgi:hypothetical protein